MCIIATKPRGKELFTKETIEQMFASNSNGAGYMYIDHGKVKIRKGFMKVHDLLNSVRSLGDVTDIPMIFHFRITTHGGTSPANTHPFPITDNVGFLQAEKVTCLLGMVHNGIISTVTPRKGISDTMEYILQVVEPLRKLDKSFYLKEAGLQILTATCGSKLAFLDGNGKIVTVGEFIEDNGYCFSNTSYKPRPKPVYKVTLPTRYDGAGYGYNDWYDHEFDKNSTKIRLMPVPSDSFVLLTEKDTPNAVIEVPLDPLSQAIDSNGTLYEIDDQCIGHKLTGLNGAKVYKDDGMRVWFAWGKSDLIEIGEDF